MIDIYCRAFMLISNSKVGVGRNWGYHMRNVLISILQVTYEDLVHESDGLDFWYARELQSLLGDSKRLDFSTIIEKAKESCKNTNGVISVYFVDVNKMVPLGSDSERKIPDIILSRYACYLIAQNGDPRMIMLMPRIISQFRPEGKRSLKTRCHFQNG